MRRYLLVLDMDLLALDEELDLRPINYLVARPPFKPGSSAAAALGQRLVVFTSGPGPKPGR